jgi:hypothetical protein
MIIAQIREINLTLSAWIAFLAEFLCECVRVRNYISIAHNRDKVGCICVRFVYRGLDARRERSARMLYCLFIKENWSWKFAVIIGRSSAPLMRARMIRACFFSRNQKCGFFGFKVIICNRLRKRANNLPNYRTFLIRGLISQTVSAEVICANYF